MMVKVLWLFHDWSNIWGRPNLKYVQNIHIFAHWPAMFSIWLEIYVFSKFWLQIILFWFCLSFAPPFTTRTMCLWPWHWKTFHVLPDLFTATKKVGVERIWWQNGLYEAGWIIIYKIYYCDKMYKKNIYIFYGCCKNLALRDQHCLAGFLCNLWKLTLSAEQAGGCGEHKVYKTPQIIFLPIVWQYTGENFLALAIYFWQYFRWYIC